MYISLDAGFSDAGTNPNSHSSNVTFNLESHSNVTALSAYMLCKENVKSSSK